MHSEQARLADRIRFLDRAHRPIATVVGVIACAVVLWLFESASTVIVNYGYALALAVGVLVWWIVEMVLIGALAVFETRHNRIASDRGLPMARIRRRN